MHYAQRRSPSRNAAGIGLVVLLHLGVGYALITGLGTQFRPVAHDLTPVKFVSDPKPVVEPPPPPQPLVLQKVQDPFLVKPEIIILTPAPTPVAKGTDAPPDHRELTYIAPPQPQNDTFAGTKHIGGPALEYPHRALVMGLTGSVDVQCDVDETGRTSQCAATASEGSNAFVEAALRYVAAAQYTPATHNGVPVTEPHHKFHIVFKLDN